MHRGSDIPRILAIASIALLAACSDSTAPTATPKLTRPALVAPVPAPEAVVNAIHVNVMRKTADSIFAEFTVDKNGGWFIAGYHGVYFPPNSICEPSTSSYGVGTWDTPCQPARGKVTIHARAGLRSNGRGWIVFEEDLRFVPSSNPDKWVRLYMYSDEIRGNRPVDAVLKEKAYQISWVPSRDADPVDESLDDATLATQVLWGTGLVTRRVKHFSGYQVTNGITEEAMEY